MKLSQLEKRCKELREKIGDKEIAILDGSNGGGSPREINYGPINVNIEDYEYIPDFETDDIETQTGTVVLMGFGFY